MLQLVVLAAALYVGYTLYNNSLTPTATNIVRTSNYWTTSGTTVAAQNNIIDQRPDVDPVTQLPAVVVTYSNGYQERLASFNGTPRQKTVV